MTALGNMGFNTNDSINSRDLFRQLHSALSESTMHRKDEIIGFIKNNPSGRVLITGSAGVIIDGLDEFLGEDRAKVEHLILLGGPCIVTMRSTVVQGQKDSEYQNFANRFDLVINLDDDLGNNRLYILGERGIGISSLVLSILEELYENYPSLYHSDLSDKTSLRLFEKTIQEYDQTGDIKIIEPGIVLPSKEIIIPSNEIITEFSVLKESLIDKAYKNPGLVDNMSPRQFEEFVADMYERLGYKVELTKMTRDGGKDIVLYTNGPTGHNMYYVECKTKNKNIKIDVGLVRSFYGVVEASRATAGILVTNSSFTKDARDFEKQVFRRLTLLDYLELLKAVMSKSN